MIRAATREEMHLVRELFLEYAASLGFSLCFQGFQQELDELPGKYGSPDGVILLALEQEKLAGTVALRRFDAESAEMKRLYVRPEYRGNQLGRQLAEAVLEAAKRVGYRSVKLDTVPSMKEARALYERMGFMKIPAYYDNAECGSICLEKQIALEE